MPVKDIFFSQLKTLCRSNVFVRAFGSSFVRLKIPTSEGFITKFHQSAQPWVTSELYCDQTASSSRTFYQQYRFKGHAHWQNVAHTKKVSNAKKNAVRSTMYLKTVSAMKAGGPDPKINKALESIIKQCVSSGDVSKAIMEGWIAKFIESKDQGPGYTEFNAPKGVVFIVQTTSDSVKVKDNMKRMAKKLNLTFAKNPRWTRLFDQKGVVTVPVTETMDVTSMDHYIEVAIESGAEDVIVTDTDGNIPNVDRVLKFHCDPSKVDHVAREIQETFDLEVFSQDVDITPHSPVTMETEEESTYYQSLIDKMYTFEDVIKVFDNVALTEE